MSIPWRTILSAAYVHTSMRQEFTAWMVGTVCTATRAVPADCRCAQHGNGLVSVGGYNENPQTERAALMRAKHQSLHVETHVVRSWFTEVPAVMVAFAHTC
ncbi:hypothetical protein BCR44DRAFT_83975, partial [Catenaria anguillulae PL171]